MGLRFVFILLFFLVLYQVITRLLGIIVVEILRLLI